MLPKARTGAICLALAAFGPAPQLAAGPPAGAGWAAVQSPSGAPIDPRLVEHEAKLAADGPAEVAWLATISVALNADPGPELSRLQQQVATFLRLRTDRLAANNPGWPPSQLETLSVLMMIDPRRFQYDADFRASVVPILVDGISDSLPAGARKRLFSRLIGLEFGAAERVEVSWGLARRSSRDREILFGSWPTRLGSMAPIRSSIYSLPSAFFEYSDAADFLRAVHDFAPERELIVLSNSPLLDLLQPLAEEMPLHLIDTLGRHYTPWPRDPFAVVSQPGGPVTVVTRPNVQAQRMADMFMARELIQGLPDQVDQSWGGVRWMVAPVPFHGGHTLATPGITWASVHTLLPRITEIMAEQPTPDGLIRASTRGRFIAATRRAQSEFEAVFGQPIRFVHPLPVPESTQSVADFETMLIGGGTSDLDSLMTILPGTGNTALVADFTLGREMLDRVEVGDLDRFASAFHLDVGGEALRRDLQDQPTTVNNALIDAFLDGAAEYLRGQGMDVRRLPLLHVPEHLVEERLRLPREGFLITWTNVVYEAVDGAIRAEGFGSGLTAIDERVAGIFAELETTLRLTPALSRSVMRDGGYRCASNHVRWVDPIADRPW